MDITRELFNVVFLLYSIINFIFYVPLIWLFNLLRVCFRFVYLEELAGKVILITEASSGIGKVRSVFKLLPVEVLITFKGTTDDSVMNLDVRKHLAIEYAKEGACLALVATREKQLQTVARDAKAMGSPDVIAIPADVSKHQDCSRLIEQTIQHFGKCESRTYISVNISGYFQMELDSEVDITIVTPGLVDSNLTEEKWMEEGSCLMVFCFLYFVLEFILDQANVKWAPTVSVERCVKAIVNSTKCGDKYVVEPPWMMTVLLWKILCPEIFNWVMNFLFVTWPNISSKKARSHKSR
ncbi:NAD(P)-binding domain-containing protein [Cynara cardunculus var. scolymus]|uniref:NAD(P)-binding domain-containing protein n=1 Tax=Cynara cardunculus var. scolymus TaxID=59895 RepID=A0A118JZD2_CYNCS|nr:NAD(P)-binding domain-containing protein [Cynara cardunculus var. scolymus]